VIVGEDFVKRKNLSRQEQHPFEISFFRELSPSWEQKGFMEGREFFLGRGCFRRHFLTGAWKKRKSEEK
jgi:hypothetical protein